MALANAFALPSSDFSQVFNSMTRILSHGYCLSIPRGQFPNLSNRYAMWGMQTVFETRRARLRMLIKKYGTIAALNEALGLEKTNARLSQIKNASIRSDRGTPYEMGDPTAREIEEKLGLEIGWMDTPPTYEELDPDPMIADLIKVARQLVEEKRPNDLAHLVRVGHTFVEPHPKAANGE